MLLSKSSIYSLRDALLLTQNRGSGYIPIEELSERLDISFLAKVVQDLTAEGKEVPTVGFVWRTGRIRPEIKSSKCLQPTPLSMAKKASRIIYVSRQQEI
jgi:hypothetical protein